MNELIWSGEKPSSRPPVSFHRLVCISTEGSLLVRERQDLSSLSKSETTLQQSPGPHPNHETQTLTFSTFGPASPASKHTHQNKIPISNSSLNPEEEFRLERVVNRLHDSFSDTFSEIKEITYGMRKDALLYGSPLAPVMAASNQVSNQLWYWEDETKESYLVSEGLDIEEIIAASWGWILVPKE